MCALRRLSVLAVLVLVLLLALSAAPAAAAPGLMPDQTNSAVPALQSGLPPCRQAQLMAAECQLAGAQVQCIKTPQVGWRCTCSYPTGAVVTWVAPCPETTSHPKPGYLTAK